MDMDMPMGGAPSDGSPLNAIGVDITNSTQAADFLGEILDDTVFQVDANMYARTFWYGICAVIAVCAFFNAASRVTSRMRIRAAAANKLRPAAPSNILSKSIACLTAIGREATYSQYTPLHSRFVKVPPVGIIALVVAYLAWVILLEFVDNNVEGAQHYTSLGVRAAWLGVAQVPLLILLAGKNNLVGAVSGVSYERLNVLHRLVSRVLLLLVTLHVIFVHLAWNAYDLGPLEYATDSCIPTGWAVYSILIWMNISTIAPIRNLSYEFFVVQHIITFFGFIVAVMYHLPDTALYSRIYIYIPVALYFVDRVIRSSRWIQHNVRPARATLTALDGGVTKVCIQSKSVKQWAPGAHVFLSIPKFGIGQSHPATITSIPTSHNGDLVFILKGHGGFTARLLRSATNSSTSPLLDNEKEGSRTSSTLQVSHTALIDGPYGGSHQDFAAFDTVFLICGSTGTTFTLPILLDLAYRVQKQRLPVKRVVFLWIVKNTSWTSWISEELNSASYALQAAGIEITIRIHVTCDDKFTTGDETESKECGCECDKSLGPCCCINVDDSDSIREVRAVDQDGEIIEKKDVQLFKDRSISKSSSQKSGTKSKALPCAVFHSGRPNFYELLWDLLEVAEGEAGVAVCGPLGLNSDVRRTVARCSDERGVHKGTGAQGVYLHSECFGW